MRASISVRRTTPRARHGPQRADHRRSRVEYVSPLEYWTRHPYLLGGRRGPRPSGGPIERRGVST